MIRRHVTCAGALAIGLVLGGGVAAQDTTAVPTGRELGGVPAINYSSDEGFGYGVDLELYDYGTGVRPYRYTVQPKLEFSTGGRRNLEVFFDAPHVLPGGWRMDAFVGTERQRFEPFYGIGNAAPRSSSILEADGDYYAFDRTRTQLLANLQHRLATTAVRLLVGAGVARVTTDPLPYDSGMTLLARSLGWTPGEEKPAGWSNFVRAGLIWDTRDREIGPRRGTWTELLVQRVDRLLGSSDDYTRWTFADRRYFPLGARATFAHRLLVQYTGGTVPFYDLYYVQTSFKQLEGLGGAKTLRGIPKNRYADHGLALWNAEVRWRATDFRAVGKPWHLVLSGFVDTGRVWNGDALSLAGWHSGYGGGVRLGMGESFVAALDAGHSREATMPLYIGLGYLY